MSETAIQISGLVKYFGGRCVLKGINLAIPKGSIYGLLGRNGVGKTTMIRILLGLDSATRGSTALLGQDSQTLSSQTKARVGYVAEGHHLIQAYRVKRLIQLCRSLSPTWNTAFFDHLMKTFRLPLDRKVKALSAGMRAQLNLALAMAAVGSLAWWLQQGEEPVNSDEGDKVRRPNYTVDNFTATEMGASGTPLRRLTSIELRHFADDDSNELESPRLTLEVFLLH